MKKMGNKSKFSSSESFHLYMYMFPEHEIVNCDERTSDAKWLPSNLWGNLYYTLFPLYELLSLSQFVT